MLTRKTFSTAVGGPRHKNTRAAIQKRSERWEAEVASLMAPAEPKAAESIEVPVTISPSGKPMLVAERNDDGTFKVDAPAEDRDSVGTVEDKPAIPANPRLASALDREVNLLRTIMRDNDVPLLQSLTADLFMSRMKAVFIRMSALSNSRPEVPTARIVFGGGMDPDCNAGFFDKDDPIWRAFDSPAELEDCLKWMRLEKAKSDLAARFPSPDDFDAGVSYEDQLSAINRVKESIADVSVEDGDPEELSRPEQIEAFLDRCRNNRASLQAVREKLKISASALSNLITRETKKGNPLFRRTGKGKTGALVKTRGLGHMQTLNFDAVVDYSTAEVCFLPDEMKKFVGYKGKITENLFLIFCSKGDGGKTSGLINVAKANAEKGKRTLFINHETDTNKMMRLLAQLETGAHQPDPMKAAEICRNSAWMKNLTVETIHEPVAVEEITKWIREEGYEVVVWDYLNPYFLTSDDTTGTSPYDRFGQLLGVHLVDHGIPLFTAIQGGWDSKDVRPTWFHRSTVAMVAQDTEHFDDNWRTTYVVYKNKMGGAPGGTYLDFYFETGTQVLEDVRQISSSVFKERMAEKAKTPAQKAKEEKAAKVKQDKVDAAERKKAAAERRKAGQVAGLKAVFPDSEADFEENIDSTSCTPCEVADTISD